MCVYLGVPQLSPGHADTSNDPSCSPEHRDQQTDPSRASGDGACILEVKLMSSSISNLHEDLFSYCFNYFPLVAECEYSSTLKKNPWFSVRLYCTYSFPTFFTYSRVSVSYSWGTASQGFSFPTSSSTDDGRVYHTLSSRVSGLGERRQDVCRDLHLTEA